MPGIGFAKYGMSPFQEPPVLPVGTGASNGAVTATRKAFFDLENPELWLVGIGALCLGFIAFSTEVKVGPFHLSGSAG